MDLFWNLGLAMIGFVVGNLLFSGVLRWGAAVYEISKDASGGKPWRIVLASLPSSGPWFAVVVAFVAYYVHAQPWAVWLGVGGLAGIIVFTALALYWMRKLARAKETHV